MRIPSNIAGGDRPMQVTGRVPLELDVTFVSNVNDRGGEAQKKVKQLSGINPSESAVGLVVSRDAHCPSCLLKVMALCHG